TSIATAISSARLKADMKSGINIGTRALIRFFKLPVINVDPRALCALIIFSVSSIKVGMNLNEIDIIIAISWTGTLMLLSGLHSFSIASVSSIGLVVRVISVVMITNKTRRMVM